MRIKTVFLAGLLCAGLAGPGVARADDSVYQAFGGQPGMFKLVDIFVANLLADPRIKDKFEHANIPRLKIELEQQFCALTGGPCKYTGKDMTTAHKGMELHDWQFNALAEDLQYAMNSQGIPFRTQNHLLAPLAAMEKQVVQAP
jgi:hemoglobin